MLSRIQIAICCVLALLVLMAHSANADYTTPDLAVSALNAPKKASFGQPIRVAWTVTNLAPDPTEGDWYDTLYLSQDASLGSDDDYALGAWLQTGVLTMGESYRHQTWVSLPQSATAFKMLHPSNPGDEGPPAPVSKETFYLILVANSVGAMTEIGYTNNVYIIPITLDDGRLTWQFERRHDVVRF